MSETSVSGKSLRGPWIVVCKTTDYPCNQMHVLTRAAPVVLRTAVYNRCDRTNRDVQQRSVRPGAHTRIGRAHAEQEQEETRRNRGPTVLNSGGC